MKTVQYWIGNVNAKEVDCGTSKPSLTGQESPVQVSV